MSKPTEGSDMAGGEMTPSNSAVLDREKDEVPTASTGEAATNPGEVDEPKSLRFKLTILFLCIISLLASIDSVIVAVCLSAISADLNTSSVESFWVGTSFLLAQTITIPIYGTLSEIFGRKWAVLTAMSIFLLASILCATAKSGTWLVAARSVQGMGAGGTLSMVQIITSDITTMRERAKYQALSAFAWAIGVTAAIPMGGGIVEHTTWRWAFWINIPLCVIPIVGLSWSLRLQVDTSSLKSKLARVDYIGLALFSGASTSFLIGLTAGGTIHPWSSGRTIAPLVLGIVLYIIFVLVEWKVSTAPMMPLRIFRDRTADTGFLGAFFHGLIVWCYIYYVVIFFLGATQQSRIHASISTLACLVYTAPASIVAAVIIKRTLRFRTVICFGWAFLALGMGVNVTMSPNSSLGVLYGPRILAAIGAGILFPTPLLAVQVKQAGDDIGIATTVQVYFRSLGTAFGVAIGGVIFQNQWTSHLASSDIASQYQIPSNDAEVGYEVIPSFPKDVQMLYRWIYADSLRVVWWVMMAVSLLGLAVSLVARNESLDRGLDGKQNFVHKKEGIDADNTDVEAEAAAPKDVVGQDEMVAEKTTNGNGDLNGHTNGNGNGHLPQAERETDTTTETKGTETINEG